MNLLHTTFNNHPGGTQSAPDRYPANNPSYSGADEINTLGYPSSLSGDSVYHLTGTFSHTGGELALVFWGRPSEPISNESWGLDNVTVNVS